MSEKIMRDNLRVLTFAYARATGASMFMISKNFQGGGGQILERYFAGEISMQIKTYFRTVNRFRTKWPAGVEWPETEPIEKLVEQPDEGFVDD